MKPGTKLFSTVCDTQVMVIRGSDAKVCCGGVPMADAAPADAGTPDPAFAGGTQMGKRYVDAAGNLELLCVKAGAGSLSVDGAALQFKDAKPLPSSD